MADVAFLVLILAFFGVAGALVQACDRIIGPDGVQAEPADPTTDSVAGHEPKAA